MYLLNEPTPFIEAATFLEYESKPSDSAKAWRWVNPTEELNTNNQTIMQRNTKFMLVNIVLSCEHTDPNEGDSVTTLFSQLGCFFSFVFTVLVVFFFILRVVTKSGAKQQTCATRPEVIYSTMET